MLKKNNSVSILKYFTSIGEIIPKAITKIVLKRDNQFVIHVNKDHLYSTMFFFKKHITTQFNILIDITAIDFPMSKDRFHIVYQLISTVMNYRITIKIFVEELGMVNSLVPVYKSAGWLEREVWDLFGVYFINHPDLRRILTDYGFQGFPLRKDFPINGFLELGYSEDEKKVVYLPLEFFQEYRFFDFKNSWQN